jgi:ribonuclease HII
MTKPSLKEEKKLWSRGINLVAGVDEVGRGCFAGPVVAAAVILPVNFRATREINDSKLLTPAKREKLARIIKKNALSFSIAEISVEIINQIGIGKATQQAFAQAITGLSVFPHHILIDAFYITALDKSRQTPIVHGDGISITIAAASIIAKVYRDERMQELHLEYPHYDFYTNKGYGTKKHQQAIKTYGLCDLHRTSFHLAKFTTAA